LLSQWWPASKVKLLYKGTNMKQHFRNWLKTTLRIALLLLLSLLPLTRALAQPVAIIEDQPGGPSYLAGQLLVQFKADATDAQLLDTVNRGALRLIQHFQTHAMAGAGRHGVSHMWTGLPVRQAIQALRNHPAVEFAEPNWVYTHQALPNDFYFVNGSLWGMMGGFGCDAANGWNAGCTGSISVVVGVIDEGIQITHPDLAANIWTNPGEVSGTVGIDDDGNGNIDDIHGWDFLNNDNSVYDGTGDDHGTHVAGTIGAEGNNAVGVVGVNWDVTIIPAKFVGPLGGTTAAAIKAVDYLTALKLRALNPVNIVAIDNSWGGGGFSQALLDAIVRAAEADILFIAAAGNGNKAGNGINNDSTPYYPASYDTTAGAGYDAVISVTAIDSAGAKPKWANYGARSVDLGAPGVSVLSTLPEGEYGLRDGTSIAAAHVTGAAALYASVYPKATAYQIKSALLASAVTTGSMAGTTSTGGRLSVPALLASAPMVIDPPSAPTLIATPGSAQISLSWTASVGATRYIVKRGTISGAYDIEFSIPSGTTFIDTDVMIGTLYYYVVCAVNAGGAGVASNEATATPAPLPPPPEAPTTLAATALSKSRINLSWTDNSNIETSFRIDRKVGSGSFLPYAEVGANVTAWSDTGLTSNTTYSYRVYARNEAGNSLFSNVASAKTPKN
jgi:subtilisin family serine protease